MTRTNRELKFSIITIFPDSIKSYFNYSILKKAIKNEKIEINFFNPIDFSENKNNRIDDKSYGGGPGMVLEAMPVIKAWHAATKASEDYITLFFTPSGKKITDKLVKKIFLKCDHIVLICGRYEGIDERVVEVTSATKISIGDYILTGGEIAALVVVDTMSREIDGVLGNIDSNESKRIAASKVYTRPETIKWNEKLYSVPEILLSGNHKDIDNWRQTE